MKQVDLSLSPPSTFIFTGELCTNAYQLNRFAFDLKFPDIRARFIDNPQRVMSEYGLSEREQSLVTARDWTALVAAGGHMLVVTKIANALGESHLHVGAHMCGQTWKDFRASLPREVDLLPQEI